MKRKSLVFSLIFSTIICGLCSCFPLLANLDIDDSNFSYSSFNIEARINNDGSLDISEDFYLNTSKNMHTYSREISYNKNVDNADFTCSKKDIADIDLNSFYVEVNDNNAGKLTATYYNQLNDNLGNTSDNIIAFTGKKNELGEIINCEEDNRSYCKKLEIYLKDGISSNTNYKISYKIKNAVSIYDDCAILNWKLLPALDTQKNNVNLTLYYPDNNYKLTESFNENGIMYFGYGGINSSFVLEECTNNKLVAHADKLESYEEMEILTLFPNDLITSNSKTNISNETIKERIKDHVEYEKWKDEVYLNTKSVLEVVFPLSLIILLPILILTFGFVYLKFDKEHKSDFDFEYLREPPFDYGPAIMGYLVNEEEITVDHLNATLLDLARKKYIKIDTQNESLTSDNPNYKFIYDRNLDTSSLNDYEKYLLTWYFDIISDGKDEVTLNEIDNYVSKEKNALKYQECNKKWNKIVEKECKKYNFFENTSNIVLKCIAIIILGGIYSIFTILSAVKFYDYIFCLYAFLVSSLTVALIIYSSQIKKKTKNGMEHYVRWKAFENFLLEFSHFDDYPVPSIIIWEHFMVYATAFGIADKVEKQLNTKFSNANGDEINNINTSYYFYINPYYMRRRIYTSMSNSIKTINVERGKRLSNSSSGHRGGGGFGGGTSFGGGGGHSSVR